MQCDDEPDAWRELLALADRAGDESENLVPQVASRPFGMPAGHQLPVNPFAERPTYRALAGLPFAERIERPANSVAAHWRRFTHGPSEMNGRPVGGAERSEYTIGKAKSLIFGILNASAIAGVKSSARKLIRTS